MASSHHKPGGGGGGGVGGAYLKESLEACRGLMFMRGGGREEEGGGTGESEDGENIMDVEVRGMGREEERGGEVEGSSLARHPLRVGSVTEEEAVAAVERVIGYRSMAKEQQALWGVGAPARKDGVEKAVGGKDCGGEGKKGRAAVVQPGHMVKALGQQEFWRMRKSLLR